MNDYDLVRGGCLETELSVYSRLMAVNYLGVVELTRHVVPHMLTRTTRDQGHVVVVSSVQGLFPIRGGAPTLPASTLSRPGPTVCGRS